MAYRSDPAVARFQGWDAAYAMADAELFLAEQRGLRFGQPGAWLQLALVDPASGTLLGDCACHVLADTARTAEIGITLAPASQGRGLAREAVHALTGALFGLPAIERVIAHADDRNAPVHALLEALGFRLAARRVDAEWFKGEWTTLRVYELDEQTGRSQPGGRAA